MDDRRTFTISLDKKRVKRIGSRYKRQDEATGKARGIVRPSASNLDRTLQVLALWSRLWREARSRGADLTTSSDTRRESFTLSPPRGHGRC